MVPLEAKVAPQRLQIKSFKVQQTPPKPSFYFLLPILHVEEKTFKIKWNQLKKFYLFQFIGKSPKCMCAMCIRCCPTETKYHEFGAKL